LTCSSGTGGRTVDKRQHVTQWNARVSYVAPSSASYSPCGTEKVR
jgi:hypothetical protein